MVTITMVDHDLSKKAEEYGIPELRQISMGLVKSSETKFWRP